VPPFLLPAEDPPRPERGDARPEEVIAAQKLRGARQEQRVANLLAPLGFDRAALKYLMSAEGAAGFRLVLFVDGFDREHRGKTKLTAAALSRDIEAVLPAGAKSIATCDQRIERSGLDAEAVLFVHPPALISRDAAKPGSSTAASSFSPQSFARHVKERLRLLAGLTPLPSDEERIRAAINAAELHAPLCHIQPQARGQRGSWAHALTGKKRCVGRYSRFAYIWCDFKTPFPEAAGLRRALLTLEYYK